MNHHHRSRTANAPRQPTPHPACGEGTSTACEYNRWMVPESQVTPLPAVPVRSRSSRQPPHRTGGLLVEMLVALILLGLLFATGVPSIAWVIRRQQALTRRQVALVEASNLLDTLTSRRWTDLPPGEVADVQMTLQAVEDLPEVNVSAFVEDETNTPARRITIRIDWRDGPQVRNRPVQLTGWVYP